MTTTSDMTIRTTAEETDGTTMVAIVQDEYGLVPDDVLRCDTVDRPTVAADEVMVEMRAAGVDRGTWHLMAGLPYLVRLAGFGVRAPRTRVPGLDVSGTVVAVGSEVSDFVPGDDVFGIGRGSFAEYVCVPAAKLAHKPAGLSFEEAAATPVSGLAALQGVRDHGRVKKGQHVLIVGASGGVGSFMVQIAKAFGAEVTGVCSAAKVDLVRALGADHVIDYSSEALGESGSRYDVILDTGGNTPLADLRRVLRPQGRLVIVGGEGGGKWTGGIGRQVRATATSPFVGQTLGTFISSENAADLEALAGLIEAGQVTPSVDRSFPLAETAAAIAHLTGGRARGKVVVTP